MPWHIRVLENPTIIAVTYEGVIPPAELPVVFAAGIAEGKARQRWLFLTDLSELQSGPTVIDLIQQVAQFETMGVDHRVREAIIMPGIASMEKEARFYETACRNRGYNARLFATREAGIAWLIENSAHTSTQPET
jgi:hypothetical protein